MKIIKPINIKNLETYGLALVLLFIIVHSLIRHDSIAATINAVCGITYTFIAGKGKPVCYIFGVLGSSFYCYISLKNGVWGNLALYSLYYIPMQILGYFKWKKHLKADKKYIFKTSLTKKENFLILLYSTLAIFVFMYILILIEASHPLLDSVTTIMSIAGMYLTVKRAIEQWLYWAVVNFLSLILWIQIATSGVKVYSTIIMWFIYFILAFYFYFQWKKEIEQYP